MSTVQFKDHVSEKDLKKAVTKAINGIDGAVNLLETINRASDLSHVQRKAMTQLVIYALQNVSRDTINTANDDWIPF